MLWQRPLWSAPILSIAGGLAMCMLRGLWFAGRRLQHSEALGKDGEGSICHFSREGGCSRIPVILDSWAQPSDLLRISSFFPVMGTAARVWAAVPLCHAMLFCFLMVCVAVVPSAKTLCMHQPALLPPPFSLQFLMRVCVGGTLCVPSPRSPL